MAWPDVLRWLALIVGGAASLMGLVWTLRCIFRPWMREAAREAADGLYEAAPGQRLPAAMKGLMDRIERVDARRRGDRAAMEPSSISGAVIPPVVAASVKRGTAVDTARVLQRHASKLTGARVQGGSTGARAGGGSIVRGGQVLGSLGRPGATTTRDGDGEGCWYLVYYWVDTGEITTSCCCIAGAGRRRRR